MEKEAYPRRMGEATVTPLRKRRLSGELYERDSKIEALIAELAVLPRDELIARAAISKRSDASYVPSECLIYFIRASRRDNNEAWSLGLIRLVPVPRNRSTCSRWRLGRVRPPIRSKP